MKRLSLFILVFAIAFAIFFFGPPLLSQQFGAYPLMKNGDVFDLLTPLVLIPLYWLMFRIEENKRPSLKEILAFVVLAAFWVEGQGMHLAANSIGHLLEEVKGSDVYNLTYFYDEVLSHYFWHFGIVGLSALVIFRQWRNPFTEGRAAMWLPILAGVIHGFAFFVIVVEAGTAPLGVAFAALAALFVLVWGRKNLRFQPLLLFFLTSYLLALLLFAGWGIYWQGLPQFSELGWI